MILRAIQLRSAIEHFIDREQLRYERHLREGNRQPKRADSVALSIFGDRLTTDEWDVLDEYQDLLAPLELATKDLESRVEEEKHGSVTYVLSAI